MSRRAPPSDDGPAAITVLINCGGVCLGRGSQCSPFSWMDVEGEDSTTAAGNGATRVVDAAGVVLVGAALEAMTDTPNDFSSASN